MIWLSAFRRWLRAWERPTPPRKPNDVLAAEQALRIASDHRRTQAQAKALRAARLAREGGLRRESADRLAARQRKRAEVRERNKVKIIWHRAAE